MIAERWQYALGLTCHTNEDTRTGGKDVSKMIIFIRNMLIANQLSTHFLSSCLFLVGDVFMCVCDWSWRLNHGVFVEMIAYKIKTPTMTSQSLHEYNLASSCCVWFLYLEENIYMRFCSSHHDLVTWNFHSLVILVYFICSLLFPKMNLSPNCSYHHDEYEKNR